MDIIIISFHTVRTENSQSVIFSKSKLKMDDKTNQKVKKGQPMSFIMSFVGLQVKPVMKNNKTNGLHGKKHENQFQKWKKKLSEPQRIDLIMISFHTVRTENSQNFIFLNSKPSLSRENKPVR